MDLRDATKTLLRVPDVAKWLRLADTHIQAYNRMPERFVLPADHALIKPVIEAFANDTDAFAKYIRALRDASDGTAYDELHELYRTISMRALQSERRSRIRKAVAMLARLLAAELGRQITYDEAVMVGRYVETQWGIMRIEHLSHHRRLHNTKRLTSEDRAIALASFWASIDKALDNEQLPLPSDAVQHLTETFTK